MKIKLGEIATLEALDDNTWIIHRIHPIQPEEDVGLRVDRDGKLTVFCGLTIKELEDSVRQGDRLCQICSTEK